MLQLPREPALSTNYDPKTDSYHTTWAEPGINCENCHGPRIEHNKIAKATPKTAAAGTADHPHQDHDESAEERSLLELPREGKPLTIEYKPEERFFDHFDLVTLEDTDYYVDGCDLEDMVRSLKDDVKRAILWSLRANLKPTAVSMIKKEE